LKNAPLPLPHPFERTDQERGKAGAKREANFIDGGTFAKARLPANSEASGPFHEADHGSEGNGVKSNDP
jgi:hypothetical protein